MRTRPAIITGGRSVLAVAQVIAVSEVVGSNINIGTVVSMRYRPKARGALVV